MANQSINLNLIPSGIAEVVNVTQGDVGRTITFTIYQGDSAWTPPSGTTVQVRGMKGDQHVFVYTQADGYVSISGNVITLTTSTQMTAAPGDATVIFQLSGGGATLGTLHFTMRVQADPAAVGDASDSELPSIISMATEQMTRAEAAAVSATASKNAASASEVAAKASETAAKTSETNAAASATSAQSAKTAAQSAQAATTAIQYESEAWAVGTKNGTPVSSSDQQHNNNSKYWSARAEHYAEQFGKAVKWQGAITFSQIPTTGMENGDLYDITNAFTTDSRFVIGSGVSEPAGTDIVWNEHLGKWDVNTSGAVASFNGRTGIVNPASGDYSADQITYGNKTVATGKNDTLTVTTDADALTDNSTLVSVDGQDAQTGENPTGVKKHALSKVWTYISSKIGGTPILTSDIVSTQTNSESKVPSAALVYGMNTVKTALSPVTGFTAQAGRSYYATNRGTPKKFAVFKWCLVGGSIAANTWTKIFDLPSDLSMSNTDYGWCSDLGNKLYMPCYVYSEGIYVYSQNALSLTNQTAIAGGITTYSVS